MSDNVNRNLDAYRAYAKARRALRDAQDAYEEVCRRHDAEREAARKVVVDASLERMRALTALNDAADALAHEIED